jgi:hypothetical protein
MSIRPITDTLRLLHGGLFLDECSDKMAGIVRSVDDTGKAGRLTITLEVKKVSGALSVTAKVTDKVPERAPDADLFYPTVEGNLSVDNPNQRKLDLRPVDVPNAAPKAVDPDRDLPRQTPGRASA